ncbi:uncharacterized protein LOC127869549 isoform X6 [Dreissena polymorpha]|uniref:uncharacterized protein LOC127869549 isoform X6 n=1 Tax=Dreissena polymorpha TaxID=45954 RepID=UPI002264F6B9|nr:uncharacterized protein LOC127869549 isoform X6 [Dreissena polymorpha]
MTTMLTEAPNMEEFQNSQRFVKAVKLNYDIGGELLRQIVKHKLSGMSQPLDQFLHPYQRKFNDDRRKRILSKYQVSLLNSNTVSLDKMDLTMLTYLLLNIFTISTQNEKDINELRNCRNELAHNTDAHLKTDDVFNRTFDTLKSICVDLDRILTTTHPGVNVSTYTHQLVCGVKELEKQNLVSRVSHRFRIQLCTEKLMNELFEKNDSLRKDDCLETKYQIIVGAGCIGRYAEVDVLVEKLRTKKIVSHQKKLEIQQEHNNEEKAFLLVLDIIKDTDENVLKFLKCLQKDYPIVAEWITGDTDDKDIDNKLRDLEKVHIKKIIEDGIETDGSKCISGEDLHVYVEENRKCCVTFLNVKECIISTFPGAIFVEKSNRFSGLSWKSCVTMFDETHLPDVGPLSTMACEEFSKYLEVEVRKNITKDPSLGFAITDVIKSESISLQFFVDRLDIVEDELKKEFNLRGLKYGAGISGGLERIRNDIKKRLSVSGTECESDFRPFGRSSGNFAYKNGKVKQDKISMLTPVHHFIMPKQEKQMHKSFFAAEVIKFAAACINGLQNGTVHFGIKALENNEGLIVGLRKTEFSPHTLIAEIENCLHHCFEGPCFEQRIFERAIQAVVIVPCEENSFVVEVDINPSFIFMKNTPITLLFPPHGEQENKLFKYIVRHGIYILEVIDSKKADCLKTEMKELLLARKILEMAVLKPEKGLSNTGAQLQKRLTAGNRYVTDQMVPHIICGKYSSIPNSDKIFDHIRVAFLSSPVVFDFDPSTVLIKNIEKEDNYFDVLVADDYKPEKCPQNIGSGNHWIYCNGNVECKLQSFPISEWLSERYPFVKCSLEESFKVNSSNRSIALFLVFESLLKTDSLYQIAFDCCRWYPYNTVVISDTEEHFSQLRKDLEPITEPQTLNQIFFSGLPWMDVASEVLSPIFPCVSGSVWRLPTSSGTVVTLTQNERKTMKLCDIEILSCEECKLAFEEMDKTLQDDTFSKEENAFYKGSEASWWNFYFDVHVCQRDIFENITSTVQEKIDNGKKRVEVLKIFHQPGAGGTTLGRHVLWHFSQCKEDLSKVYRCCVIRNVIENDSADQILKLWSFKDKNKDERNPVIVLADNIPEESLVILIDNLNDLVYRHASSHGKLLCLLIVVARIWESKGASVVLRQVLSDREILWFQDRSQSLEKKKSKKQIESMIAFNVMKEGFSEKYINDTTRGIMKGLKRKEEKLVQHLSFLNSYEPDVAVGPDIFDDLMRIETSTRSKWTIKELKEVGAPVGLVGSQRRFPYRQTWNVESSEFLELLIKHSSNGGRNQISIVSPLIAKASLQYIMEKENLDLKKVVSEFLSFFDTQFKNEPSSDSNNRLRKNVCDLFCHRQQRRITPFRDGKSAFSNLVTELSEVNKRETSEEAFNRTNDLMSYCFQITNDSYVAQHRTRLCNHFKEFQSAKEAITLALKGSEKIPILYDTFGHIYKKELQDKSKKSNTDPKELIKLACNAIAKFREAQQLGRKDNLAFYEQEISVAFLILDDLKTKYKEPFLKAINGFSHEKSMPELYPEINSFCNGSEMQSHIKASLQHIEDVFTMTKQPFHLSSAPETAIRIQSMINKFESIYTTDFASSSAVESTISCSFTGMRNLYDEDQNKLANRVYKLEFNFDASGKRLENNLKVIVGYYIIHYSMISCPKFDEKIQFDYRKLLNFSEMLLKCQNERMGMNNSVENLEPYLYFALLHWPLPKRLHVHKQYICRPEYLKMTLNRWQELYDQKFDTSKKGDQSKLSLKAKTFFALARGQPGGDYVHTNKIRSQWRIGADAQGRKRREVKRDDIWNHKLGLETFIRISGVVDGSGRNIDHSVEYDADKIFQYRIPSGEDCFDYRNRRVTFVLGISWRGPVAYDVKLKEEGIDDDVCQKVESASLVHMDNPTGVGCGIEEGIDDDVCQKVESASLVHMDNPTGVGCGIAPLTEHASPSISFTEPGQFQDQLAGKTQANPVKTSNFTQAVKTNLTNVPPSDAYSSQTDSVGAKRHIVLAGVKDSSWLPTVPSTHESSSSIVSGASTVIGRGRGRSRGYPVVHKPEEVATRPGRSSPALKPTGQGVGGLSTESKQQQQEMISSSVSSSEDGSGNMGAMMNMVCGPGFMNGPMFNPMMMQAGNQFIMPGMLGGGNQMMPGMGMIGPCVGLAGMQQPNSNGRMTTHTPNSMGSQVDQSMLGMPGIGSQGPIVAGQQGPMTLNAMMGQPNQLPSALIVSNGQIVPVVTNPGSHGGMQDQMPRISEPHVQTGLSTESKQQQQEMISSLVSSSEDGSGNMGAMMNMVCGPGFMNGPMFNPMMMQAGNQFIMPGMLGGGNQMMPGMGMIGPCVGLAGMQQPNSNGRMTTHTPNSMGSQVDQSMLGMPGIGSQGPIVAGQQGPMTLNAMMGQPNQLPSALIVSNGQIVPVVTNPGSHGGMQDQMPRISEPHVQTVKYSSWLPTVPSTHESNSSVVPGASTVIGRGRGRSRGYPVVHKSEEVATRPSRSSPALKQTGQGVGAPLTEHAFPFVSFTEPGQFQDQPAGKTQAKPAEHGVQTDIGNVAPSDAYSSHTGSGGAKGNRTLMEEESNASNDAIPIRNTGRRQRKKEKKKEKKK